MDFALAEGVGDDTIGMRGWLLEVGLRIASIPIADSTIVVNLVLPLQWSRHHEVDGDDFTFTPETPRRAGDPELDFAMYTTQLVPTLRVVFPAGARGSGSVLVGFGPGSVWHASSDAGSFVMRLGGELRTSSRFGVSLTWQRASISYSEASTSLPEGSSFVLRQVEAAVIVDL